MIKCDHCHIILESYSGLEVVKLLGIHYHLEHPSNLREFGDNLNSAGWVLADLGLM